MRFWPINGWHTVDNLFLFSQISSFSHRASERRLRASFSGRYVVLGSDERCPKEGGVVLTRYGTVALGSVVAAIAAALEPQIVKTRLLMTMPLEEEQHDVDVFLSRESISSRRSMWLKSVAISDTQVDNVWIATIAGGCIYLFRC